MCINDGTGCGIGGGTAGYIMVCLGIVPITIPIYLTLVAIHHKMVHMPFGNDFAMMKTAMRLGILALATGPPLVLLGTRCLRDDLYCGVGGTTGGSTMLSIGTFLIAVAVTGGGSGCISACGVEGTRSFRILTSTALLIMAVVTITTGTVCIHSLSECRGFWDDFGDARGYVLCSVGLGLVATAMFVMNDMPDVAGDTAEAPTEVRWLAVGGIITTCMLWFGTSCIYGAPLCGEEEETGMVIGIVVVSLTGASL